MSPENNHYDVLCVSRDADLSAIRAAWKARAKVAHPDKGGNHEEMLRLNQAYAVLADSRERERYDEWLRSRDRSAFGRYVAWSDDDLGRREARDRWSTAYPGDSFDDIDEWFDNYASMVPPTLRLWIRWPLAIALGFIGFVIVGTLTAGLGLQEAWSFPVGVSMGVLGSECAFLSALHPTQRAKGRAVWTSVLLGFLGCVVSLGLLVQIFGGPGAPGGSTAGSLMEVFAILLGLSWFTCKRWKQFLAAPS